MPWNSAVESEYYALISGDIEQASDHPWESPLDNLADAVKPYLKDLENGVSPLDIKLTPSHDSFLTEDERKTLHLMRVACALYAERNAFYPWRLGDFSAAELRPLLSYQYMGLLEDGAGMHKFHRVWDMEPGLRMVVAALSYRLAALFGFEVPTSADWMVLNRIQWMRDIGWQHISGDYKEYEGYHDHGDNVYDFDDVTEVKRSGCHLTADYLVAVLRHFNVPAHYGRGWSGPFQPTGNAYWSNIHIHEHCFIHFTAANGWFSHADDVYGAVWITVAPKLALMSDDWMEAYQFDESEYTWTRGRIYQMYVYWCIMIGQSSDLYYDVPTLYANGVLRDRLENLHIESNLAYRDGAPAEVPPVFDEYEVDFLMDWVEEKLN